MPAKRKRRIWRAYTETPPARWSPKPAHVHTMMETTQYTGGLTLIIDRCTGEGCTYEVARDLIAPERGDI